MNQTDPSKVAHYQPFIYAADLLLPVINLGQKQLRPPAGFGQWLAALIGAGWVLATAVIAGITRVLTRN